MNENHKLENILAGLGGEPVPDDIHQLAEAITNEFRRGLATDPAAVSPNGTQHGGDSTISHDATQSSVRLVPDVPTELADGVSRETHSIVPPDRRHVPRRFVAMLHSKTVRWSAAATIAAAVILVIGFWPGKAGRGPGNAFAAAIEHFQKAKTIVCRITTSTSGGVTPVRETGKLSMSAEYGSRCEMFASGGTTPMLIQYAPSRGPVTTVTPYTSTYTVVDAQTAGGRGHGSHAADSAGTFIRALSELKGQASRELGRMAVNGVDCLGYEISGQLLGLGSSEGVRSELWIDAATCLPVRYLAEMPMPDRPGQKGATLQTVYDQFEWDAVVDPKEFVPAIPEGYKRLDVTTPVAAEAALIKGLGFYVEIADKYPPALDAATVTTDLAAAMGARMGAAVGRGENVSDQQQQLTQKALEIGAGVAYYQKLVAGKRSPEYHGKTVKPGEKDAVLLRWKTEDGQWRVIYGDLRVETIPAK